MRKLTLTIAGLAALAATSVAVANGIEGAKTTKAVSATFSANAGTVTTRTCTTTDNKSISVTDAKYTGAASGDADLTGPITLRARSVVNTTDGVGTVNGAFRIDVASGRDTVGSLSTVYDHGTIAGLAVGRAHDPGVKLLGNISATFTPGTSFASGKIGGGTAAGSAVEIGTGSCKPQNSHPEQSEARGTISALSTQSITVAGLPCALPSDKASDINSKFKVGDAVQIRCAYTNGQNTLTRIDKRH
ncbi:MAG: hypothetical protein ACXVQQ_00570 [Gaiellaceae bacterium]